MKALAVNRLVARLGLSAPSRFAPWQRLCALTTLGGFAWTLFLRPPLLPMAKLGNHPPPLIANNKNPMNFPKPKRSQPHFSINYHQPAPKPPHPLAPATRSLSLLDALGQPTQSVSPTQRLLWRKRLHQPKLSPLSAAWLHLWLAQTALGQDQHPQAALKELAWVRHFAQPSWSVYGLALYDTGLALYEEGRYAEAAALFHRLVAGKPALHGVDLRDAALLYRECRACYGYHASHAKAGIPEPAYLDPWCGASGLALCFGRWGLPTSKAYVAKVCKVTGRGSSLADLVAGARRVGLHAYPLAVHTEQVLMALPKPLIAFVEHDHFIGVVGADKRGVEYVCS